MIIDKPGKYRTLSDITVRSSYCISVIKAGYIIKITQIDKQNHKIIGPDIYDWIHWDIPVEPVGSF